MNHNPRLVDSLHGIHATTGSSIVMENLANQSCEACRSDSPSVEGDQIDQLLRQIPDWNLRRDNGINKLVRRYSFKDFAQALAFTNRIGGLAESERHHPDLLTTWGGIEVTWWTHKIKGLHVNDVVMAAKSDREFNRQ